MNSSEDFFPGVFVLLSQAERERERERERDILAELQLSSAGSNGSRSIGDEYGRAGYRAAGHRRTFRLCNKSLSGLSPDTGNLQQRLLCLGDSRNLSHLRSTESLVPSHVVFPFWHRNNVVICSPGEECQVQWSMPI